MLLSEQRENRKKEFETKLKRCLCKTFSTFHKNFVPFHTRFIPLTPLSLISFYSSVLFKVETHFCLSSKTSRWRKRMNKKISAWFICLLCSKWSDDETRILCFHFLLMNVERRDKCLRVRKKFMKRKRNTKNIISEQRKSVEKKLPHINSQGWNKSKFFSKKFKKYSCITSRLLFAMTTTD